MVLKCTFVNKQGHGDYAGPDLNCLNLIAHRVVLLGVASVEDTLPDASAGPL